MKNLKKNKLFFSLILVITIIFSMTLIASAAMVTIGTDGTADFTNAQFYILGSSNVTTYTTAGGTTVSGAIYPNDLCKVLSVTGTYWKVSYPTSSGTKTAYCNKAAILSNTSYCKRISIDANTTVYRKSDMSTTFGTVFTTDTIYMLSPISGGKSQIIYNVSGGFKIGWIYATAVQTQLDYNFGTTSFSTYVWINNGNYFWNPTGLDMDPVSGTKPMWVDVYNYQGTLVHSYYLATNNVGGWRCINFRAPFIDGKGTYHDALTAGMSQYDNLNFKIRLRQVDEKYGLENFNIKSGWLGYYSH